MIPLLTKKKVSWIAGMEIEFSLYNTGLYTKSLFYFYFRFPELLCTGFIYAE